MCEMVLRLGELFGSEIPFILVTGILRVPYDTLKQYQEEMIRRVRNV